MKTLFLIQLLVLISISNALKNVTISKCCGLRERMSEKQGFGCNPDSNEKWFPKIYLHLKNKYLDPLGTIPTNFFIKESHRPNCELKLFKSFISYLVLDTGFLWLVEYDKFVDPSDYCIDRNVSLVCLTKVLSPHQMHTKVKKCCGEKAIYSNTKKSCINMKTSDYKIELGENITLISGFPACKEPHMVIAGKTHDADLNHNGSLWLRETKTLLGPESFCLEHILENAGPSSNIFTCPEYIPSSVTINKSQEEGVDLRFTLYPIGLALSAVFLAATLAAGRLLPASHHVLHWRCQTNHVACLLVGDVLLCITQLAGKSLNVIPCVLIAMVMHFFFLAAFFWLNTMCFNIWWTFRDLRPQSIEKGQERCRLRLYEVYAWGVPFLIASTAAILDMVPESPEYAFIRPQFGKKNCWFYGDTEIFTFFFGPIGILLVVNLALFAATARELTCGLWKRELVKSTTERAALGRVCMKLVIVMGVTWIADVISWAVGGPQELWYITDCINCLQGIFIFIVVGCQPQVLTAVKRLWCWRNRHPPGTAGTTNHHSSSSQGLPSLGDTVTTNNSINAKTVPLETTC